MEIKINELITKIIVLISFFFFKNIIKQLKSIAIRCGKIHIKTKKILRILLLLVFRYCVNSKKKKCQNLQFLTPN